MWSSWTRVFLIGLCLYLLYVGIGLIRNPEIRREFLQLSTVAFQGDTPFERIRQSAESAGVAASLSNARATETSLKLDFRVKWTFRPAHVLPFLPSPVVTDTDSDGQQEILFTDGGNTLYGLIPTSGITMWTWSPPFGQLTPAQNEIIPFTDDGTGGAKRAVVVTSFVTPPFRVYGLDPRPGVRYRYIWTARLPGEALPGGVSRLFHRDVLKFLGLSVKVLDSDTNMVRSVYWDPQGRRKERLEPLEISPADAYNDRRVGAGEILYDLQDRPGFGVKGLFYDDAEYSVVDHTGRAVLRIRRDATERRLENDLFLFHRTNDDLSIGHLSLAGDRLKLSEYGIRSRTLTREYVAQLDMQTVASGFSRKWNLSHSDKVPERRGLVQIADIDGDHRWELMVQLDDALMAMDTPFELPVSQIPRVESGSSIYAVDHEIVARSWISYGAGSRLFTR